jgi:[ribosomal protein S5]-alanine N-acetyltransferase
MKIKLAAVEDAACLSDYYLENSEHLQPWERTVHADFHNVDAWEARLAERVKEQQQGRGAYFLAYADEEKKIMASCNLTGITRGAFQACYMGYSVAKRWEGQGIMKKLCQHAINHAFRELGLNRVMANYMPANLRSEILLASMGFVKEGFAKNYLFINGHWEDHIMTALVNPDNMHADDS